MLCWELWVGRVGFEGEEEEEAAMAATTLRGEGSSQTDKHAPTAADDAPVRMPEPAMLQWRCAWMRGLEASCSM